MDIPSVYQAGYEKARALNPQLAATYVRHTMIDDPVADAAIDALAACGQKDVHQFIHAGMEQDVRALAAAPQPLQDFFDSIDAPPPWFDPASVDAGCRAFHQYSDLFIPAFIVVTLQNFTSLMSKVFYMTGRVTTPYGLRRIRQNTRHFIEIMLPGALERQGEGWKLSVRIRLVHARVRWLLRASGNWDEAVYGVPLSAAHMGLAAANFSATMLHQAERLGARLDAEARASFMQTWRYASWLAGTPEALLFEGDEAKTHELYRIARICEPPPNEEAAAVANALVTAKTAACRPFPSSLRVAVRAVRLLHLGRTLRRVSPVRFQAVAGVSRGAGDPHVPRRTGNGHFDEPSLHLSLGRDEHAGDAVVWIRCHEVAGAGELLGATQLSVGAIGDGAAQPRATALRQADASVFRDAMECPDRAGGAHARPFPFQAPAEPEVRGRTGGAGASYPAPHPVH
jgi:hypothetical protein